jgi:hypothetical protein
MTELVAVMSIPVGAKAMETVPVYVEWCDQPLVAHVEQGAHCPRCGADLHPEREGGLLEHLRALPPNAVWSVSETCPTCHAIVHWDATPPDDRPRLGWLRTVRKE